VVRQSCACLVYILRRSEEPVSIAVVLKRYTQCTRHICSVLRLCKALSCRLRCSRSPLRRSMNALGYEDRQNVMPSPNAVHTINRLSKPACSSLESSISFDPTVLSARLCSGTAMFEAHRQHLADAQMTPHKSTKRSPPVFRTYLPRY
jgi:hypothetical protein